MAQGITTLTVVDASGVNRTINVLSSDGTTGGILSPIHLVANSVGTAIDPATSENQAQALTYLAELVSGQANAANTANQAQALTYLAEIVSGQSGQANATNQAQALTYLAEIAAAKASSIDSTNYVTSGAVNLTSNTVAQAISAQGAGLYTYITSLDCYNSGNYATTVNVLNSSNAVLYSVLVPPGGGWVKQFSPAYIGGGTAMTANTAVSLQAQVITGGSGSPSVTCNIQGFKSNS